MVLVEPKNAICHLHPLIVQNCLIQCKSTGLKRVALELFGNMEHHHLNIAMEKQCFGKKNDMIGGTFVVIGMVENAYQKVVLEIKY